MGLNGCFCIVTGVTSGIGHATTRALLAHGAEVCGIARDAQKLAVAASDFGVGFTGLLADLAVPEQRAHCFSELQALSRPVHVLVNNAAECVYQTPLSVAPAQLRRLFDINVLAGFELCQALAPHMPAGAQVVQISSVTARQLQNPKFGPYGATKAALEHLSDALRLELVPKGIRVAVIVPGLVDTPIYDKVSGFERARAKLSEQVPVWLRPEDVAEAVTWILTRPKHVSVSELVMTPSAQAG